jgi:hypothetical protein
VPHLAVGVHPARHNVHVADAVAQHHPRMAAQAHLRDVLPRDRRPYGVVKDQILRCGP